MPSFLLLPPPPSTIVAGLLAQNKNNERTRDIEQQTTSPTEKPTMYQSLRYQ